MGRAREASVLTFLLVFLAGALFEGCYLAWVLTAARGLPLRAAFFSVVTGALSLYGISATVQDPLRAPALLLGYGAATYLIVRFGPKAKDLTGG